MLDLTPISVIMVLDTIYSYGMVCHIEARMLFHHKETRGDVIIEMVIWQLPDISVERPHRLKYRFFCGNADACLIRYDNETGKGDHRHYGDREEAYDFQSIERLVEDFRNDCVRLAAWEW